MTLWKYNVAIYNPFNREFTKSVWCMLLLLMPDTFHPYSTLIDHACNLTLLNWIKFDAIVYAPNTFTVPQIHLHNLFLTQIYFIKTKTKTKYTYIHPHKHTQTSKDIYNWLKLNIWIQITDDDTLNSNWIKIHFRALCSVRFFSLAIFILHSKLFFNPY